MTKSLPRTGYGELLLLLLRRRKRLKVTGRSMQPLLQPGDEITIDPFSYRQSLPQVGDVVVVVHPHRAKLIVVKRITAIDGGKYFLTGDNPKASTDSRHWGFIEVENILGKVTSRFM